MSVLLDWALQPIGFLSILWSAGLLSGLFYRHKPRPVFWLLLTSVSAFWLLSAPSFANPMVHWLENRRSNPTECDLDHAVRPIIVLSGGLDKYVDSNSPYQILNRDSLLRISKAIDIARPESPFYLLGGDSHTRKASVLMASLLRDRGIHSDRIIYETQSRSTRENAEALAALLPVTQSSNITLITSALHIARASATFEKAGYKVCHVAADTQYSEATLPVGLLPYLSGLTKSTLVIHELIALVIYRFRGYV